MRKFLFVTAIAIVASTITAPKPPKPSNPVIMASDDPTLPPPPWCPSCGPPPNGPCFDWCWPWVVCQVPCAPNHKKIRPITGPENLVASARSCKQ